MSATTVDPWVIAWLSKPRFDRYVAAAAGDVDRALALYEWNARVAKSVLRDLAHFEVGLRNAYDQAVCARWKGRQHWLIDASSPVRACVMRRGKDINERSRNQLREAMSWAGGRGASPGKVIAELPFGFWRSMSTRAYEVTLWVPFLRHAYPSGTSRQTVDSMVARLHSVRNRIAHHEPLLSCDLAREHRTLLELTEMINPGLADHLERTSWSTGWLSMRP